MNKEYRILPMNSNDRLIMNWDYDDYGRWGQKQFIKCFSLIIMGYLLLFYVLYLLFV
jgi:hypothetical protein